MKLISTSVLSLLLINSLLTACGGGSDHGSTAASTEIPKSSSSSSVSSVSSSSSSLLSSSSSSIAVVSSSSSSSSSSLSTKHFTLTSASFPEDAVIPSQYTCDGLDINPQLSWQNAPADTKSFTIIVDDPDALEPFGLVWVHWNIYNISASASEITEGASTHIDKLPAGSVETASDFGSAKYRGPCPPTGRHHYKFQIYALNKESISFNGPLTRSEFEAAFGDSIIDTASTAGYFR